MMIDFSKKLPRTVRTLEQNKRLLVENNKSFLEGKSLLEFGVCEGKSLLTFSELYDEYGLEKIFYGFDAFLGLPKETLDKNNPKYWYEGTCDGGSVREINEKLPFVKVIDGWFKDTLNDETLKEVEKNEVGIFHIDCDIYTSTMQVWEWIIKNNLLVDGSLVVYDDWGGYQANNVGEFECGEGKAHKEIVEKYGLDFEFISCDIISHRYEVCTFRYNAN